MGWAKNQIDIPETHKSLQELLHNLKENYELSIKRWTSFEYSPDNKKQIQFLSEIIKKMDKHLQTK